MKPKVYFSRTITPEKVLELYKLLGKALIYGCSFALLVGAVVATLGIKIYKAFVYDDTKSL